MMAHAASDDRRAAWVQQSNEKCECTSVADGVPFPISPKKTETKSSVNPVLVKIKINVEILNNPV